MKIRSQSNRVKQHESHHGAFATGRSVPFLPSAPKFCQQKPLLLSSITHPFNSQSLKVEIHQAIQSRDFHSVGRGVKI